jgi:hypothetical protein
MGPNRVDVSLPIWERKWIMFQKHYVFQFLEYRTMVKVQTPSKSECLTYITYFKLSNKLRTRRMATETMVKTNIKITAERKLPKRAPVKHVQGLSYWSPSFVYCGLSYNVLSS